jgi:hypothetical protein
MQRDSGGKAFPGLRCAPSGLRLLVTPALVAGIHVLKRETNKDVDGRNKSGHDVE